MTKDDVDMNHPRFGLSAEQKQAIRDYDPRASVKAVFEDNVGGLGDLYEEKGEPREIWDAVEEFLENGCR